MKCAWRLFWSRNNFRLSIHFLLVLFVFLATFEASGETANVYEVGGAWRDEGGHGFSLSSLRGKRTVFALFYSSCKTICPMTVKSLKTIEKAVAGSKDLQFVLVTIDPKADGPKQLADFATTQHLQGWKILTGRPEDTKALAIALGLGFEEKRGNVDLHQMHSKSLVVIKESGQRAGALPLFDFEMADAEALLASK
jgi:protein SCO1/2